MTGSRKARTWNSIHTFDLYAWGEILYTVVMGRTTPLTVIDFFCGAGGFSEGFRQQGFKIVMGIDNWQPAIDTHNINHGLCDTVHDVLDYWSENSADASRIDELPNTEVIIGSPSCVSFSMANKAGKADKTLGIQLIEAYLRVVAVKKHQRNSRLKAWFMENVPQSKPYIKDVYTFDDLNLGQWAMSNKMNPSSAALTIKGEILNAGDYGAPQDRKRYIVSEFIRTGEYIKPDVTHTTHVKLSDIKGQMPAPNSKSAETVWTDPNYPSLKLKMSEITDHFYDTGLYAIEWEKAEHLKVNHPFMGRMAFPENENRTSRTITATRSGATREALIYRSEFARKGNGEYRLPTIREAASLMGFPYTYQFSGSESVKWKQVGNSVCPQMSAALARALRGKLGLQTISKHTIEFSSQKLNVQAFTNLNTFSESRFDKPRHRKESARFRRHPIKVGNMTVDLLNYNPLNKGDVASGWYVAAFFGTGNEHGVKILSRSDLSRIEKYVKRNDPVVKQMRLIVPSRGISSAVLQEIFESDLSLEDDKNPLRLVKKIGDVLARSHDKELVDTKDWLPKTKVPKQQLYAMYGLLQLIRD